MNELLNSPGFVAVVSMIGAVAVAYIANIYSKTVKSRQRPRDHMETVLGGYERLIKQQDKVIEALKITIASLENDLIQTKNLLNATVTQNEELKRQLAELKTTVAKEAV
jgi:septal ring factor EnvC (AmiA/AmiB activator)